MSLLELTAASFGLVNLVLIARRTIWNYPFGIIAVALYFAVFLNARLYSAAILQVFFLGAQLYGCWYWRRSTDGTTPVPVRPLSPRAWPPRPPGRRGLLRRRDRALGRRPLARPP